MRPKYQGLWAKVKFMLLIGKMDTMNAQVPCECLKSVVVRGAAIRCSVIEQVFIL